MGGGPAVGPEAVVQTRGDGALMALLVAALPAATYAAIHWVVLGFGLHVYSMLLLAGGMPLVLALLPGGMWWLAPTPVAPVNAARSAPAGISPSPSAAALSGANPTKGLAGFLRRSIIVLGLLVALVGFEGRVVFHGFGQYIKLPAPWNWVAVTFALFGCAGVGLMHVTGALGSTVDVTVAGSLLLLCTTAGALVRGASCRRRAGKLTVMEGHKHAPYVYACGYHGCVRAGAVDTCSRGRGTGQNRPYGC